MKKKHSSRKKYGIWIDLLSLTGVIVAIYLVIKELVEAEYCPRYPLVEIPACYLVLVFFLTVYITRFVQSENLKKTLFYVASSFGLVTALWFSGNHLLNKVHCPVLFGIPLCFAALLTFLAIIIIGIRGYFK